MKDAIWNAVMWNHLIYPEHSPLSVDTETLVSDWISSKYPDFVVCISIDAAHSLPKQLCSTLHLLLPEEYRPHSGITHGNSLYFCGILASGSQDVLDEIEELRSNISRQISHTCTAGIAFLRDKTPLGLSWAAQRAVVSQRRKLREGTAKTYLFDESYMSADFSFLLYRNMEERFHAMVRTADISQLETSLTEAADMLFTGRYLALNHLRPIIQTQIILLSHQLIEIGASPESVHTKTEALLTQTASTYDYTVLKGLFEDAIRWYVRKSVEMCSQHATKIVTLAEDIIKSDLCNPQLSLATIARSLYTNPSYLSRIFKQQKDVGITRYINQHRVQFAMRLLSDRTKSITDIAYDAGFSSLTHFGRMFKAISGLTPSQYRQSKNVEKT